jgi:hypothetical protein
MAILSSIQNPADAVNLALTRVGYKGRMVANLYDGSVAAKISLQIYGQTRDALMRDSDYGFCERNLNLVLLKQAPATGYFPPNPWNPATNPPPPWFYEYQYPSDCLKIRSIKPVPLFVQNYDPRPNVFAVENDNNYNPPQKVILCDVQSAMAVYTGRVTDPTTWEADFAEEFIDALGRRLAPSLANMDVAKFEAAIEGIDAKVASETEG